MYLAIGFLESQGFVGSRNVDTTNPQEVADYLNREFGVYFDRILLVANDDDSPSVVQHWSIDRDYEEPPLL